MKKLQEHREPVWHHLPADRVLAALKSNQAHGLTAAEAARRRQEYGANRLTARKGKSPLRLFLSQFHHPLIYILLISAAISGSLKGWVDASVILGVVLINAIIGFIQEMNALRAIAALANALSISAAVLRDGQRQILPAAELVPGDIVLLQSGDKVPADLRLLQVRELQIDESALTGESVPVEKNPGRLPSGTLLADRANLAYSSTLVTYGTGTGVVVATGDYTEIGRINRLLAEATELQTPLTRKIGQFSWVLMWFILGLAALAFLAGWWRGADLIDTFMASVALAVAAIPEGLPVAVTITLAIGVKRMARRNAIIRKLPAVETLGSTTVICSDKTGTLTQNQMTVQAIVAGGVSYAVTGAGYEPVGEFRQGGQRIDPGAHPALSEILRAGLLCNDARLFEADGAWQIEGDPTEAALLVAARKGGWRPEPLAETHPRVDVIPFESAHQFMATLHHNRAEDAHHIYLKGSVERLLERCDAAFDAALNRVPLDREVIEREVAGLTARGLRVLAFARGDHEEDPRTRSDRDQDRRTLGHHHVREGLTFIGLQAMIDPPRPAAILAIGECRKAGIRVKMITGDHAGTAVAIAGQIGLAEPGQTIRALDGRQLAAITDEQLPAVAEQTAVFAHVEPEQKLRLVTALQQAGHVVAMTGDGVNDAAALRQANIGVAMGITGTEVSKEAAAMVLTDDNFATIAAAVEEGRGVYDNLIKFITWTIPTNIGEGLVVLIAIVLGLALPILPVQILWLNMSTAVLIGLPLAFEARESGIMQRWPRHPDQPILTGQLLFRSAVVGVLLTASAFALFYWELTQGETITHARTAAVNTFAIGESIYLFNCRSLTHSMFRVGVFSNPWIFAGILTMMLAQAAIIYIPELNWLFQTAPLGWEEWLLATGCGVIIYWVVGVEKFIRRRLAKADADRENRKDQPPASIPSGFSAHPAAGGPGLAGTTAQPAQKPFIMGVPDSDDNSRTWVLYHAECLDGFGAAWAAWTALGDTAHYRPVRHGDPLPEIPAGRTLYMLDFCYPPEILCQAAPHAERVVVVDHHLSAQAAVARYQQDHAPLPANLHTYFDLENSGCVLAWRHFQGDRPLPPLLAHIEDRDLWRHQLPGTREINIALYSRFPLPFTEVERLDLTELQREGTVLRQQQQRLIERLLKSRHPVTLRGVTGLAVNAPHQFASELGETLALESGTFGLIYHYQGARGLFECSLRSRGGFDVSALAAQLGGGGHRNAAGFTLKAAPALWLGSLSDPLPAPARLADGS